jgi:hypothetical protein
MELVSHPAIDAAKEVLVKVQGRDLVNPRGSTGITAKMGPKTARRYFKSLVAQYL